MLNKTLAATLSPPNSPLPNTGSIRKVSTFPFINTHDLVFNLPPHNNQQSSTPSSIVPSSTSSSSTNNTQFIATLQWKSKSALTHDVDLVAILLNKFGGIHDVCFYNNLNQVTGLKHGGDDRNGYKNLDSNRMKEQFKNENITLEKAKSDSNEYIELDLSQVDPEVRCIVFLASCYPGTVLSELSFATCNLYQYASTTATNNEQEIDLKLALSSSLDNKRDLCGQVFAIVQLRGGDAEVISASIIPGKEKENTNKDDDDEASSSNMDNSSFSQSPGIGGHLRQENDDTASGSGGVIGTQDDGGINSSYYWQIVSKQVDIGHNERFIDAFMYALCRDVLPDNIFISMKNRLTYIIHLRQEEKKNLNKENMAIANLLKDDDHDEDEEYIVRVYSELTGSILIDQLIVEEVNNYLTSMQINAEKSPFIPTLKDEALLQELNAKKELKSELDQDEQDLSEKKSQVDIQKSYSFNEDRVKIFMGWQSLSGRSYSRYFLTTTVLFFGKYGARLGHIDQYTNKLSLARIENHQSNNTTTTTTNSTNGSSSIANDKSSTIGNNSPRTNPNTTTPLSTSSVAIKPSPAAVFYKDNLFESGKENDLCAEIDLTRLPKSVHSIIIVVTASSNAQDSGFQELKDPFVKISSPSVGDLYRYQLNTADKAHQSFIACKLTCLRNPNESSGINFASKKNQINSMVSSGSFIGLTKWKISNIGEYSYGVHPLIDPKLKSHIQSHVTTIDLPPCIELATQAEMIEEEREKETEKLLAEQEKKEEIKEEKKENVEEVVSVGDDLDLIVLEEKQDEKKEKPLCFRISKQEVRTVGFDFSTVKNLDSLQVLEFSQFGKLLTGGKPIMVNEENDLRKRKLALSKKTDTTTDIQMGGSFIVNEEDDDEERELPRQDQMLQSLSSFHRVDLSYGKEPHAPYFICFLLNFKDIVGSEEEDALDYSLIPEKQINAFRLWNVDEKVDMCIAKMRNVYNVDGSADALEVFNCHQHANLAVIAYRGGQRDEWFIEVLDEIVEFQSPARKYLRSILQRCQFDISEPSNDIFRVPSTTTITKDFPKDNRDLVLGFGVVGNGGQRHILNAEVELYDHFGRYTGKVFDGYSDMDAKLKHRPINFLTIYTQDDEEQFDIRVRDLVESSQVKYIVANIEVKSRSVLTVDSQVYCRVVGMRTGQEIIRVQTPGSVFLDKYTKKAEKFDLNEDGYDSAEESDNDIVVTMCVIELYKGGWKIIGCGEKNIVNLIPKYIAPKPEGLKMEVSRGRNLFPVDHGSADPYLRVKLNEKNTRKGSKKQKVRTKVVNRTVNPDWHETHTIHIFDYDDYLIVKCMDYEKTRDQYMGEFRVKVGDLVRLHNSGRERRFILRDAEYWKAKEGKLVGSKKDAAVSTPAMGEVYIKFSGCPASEVTIKK